LTPAARHRIPSPLRMPAVLPGVQRRWVRISDFKFLSKIDFHFDETMKKMKLFDYSSIIF
jgi:hypothetical protein